MLKVGPGLTFALREGLFALAAIEDQLVPAGDRSHVVDEIERVMLADPGRAAPLPTTYSATATGDLWHVNQLDRDLSDSTPATTAVSIMPTV